MSKVAIIGNGNVGHHLLSRISEYHDAKLYSRKPDGSSILSLHEFDPSLVDFTILAVPDDQIRAVSDALSESNSMVLHTSGSRPIDDLNKHILRGVLYPLQTFKKETSVDFNTFPFFIESKEIEQLRSFALTFAKDVRELDSNSRSKLHLAAVFACNFSNHLYAISDEILTNIGISFKDLRHLCQETLDNASRLSPKQSQTGPAIREDTKTIANHLQLLENEDWKKIYQLISDDIRNSKG